MALTPSSSSSVVKGSPSPFDDSSCDDTFNMANGLAPKSLAFVIGENVLRPLIDATCQLATYLTTQCNGYSGVVTHTELRNRFEKVSMIGGGGEAVVFEVEDSKSGDKLAMRVGSQLSRFSSLGERRSAMYEHLMEVQNLNPHLAKTCHIYSLEMKNHPFDGSGKIRGVYPTAGLKKEEFCRTDFEDDPDAKTYYLEVMVGELGSADLESPSFRELNADPVVVEIQRTFAGYLLRSHGIANNDDKARNYVFKKHGDDCFNGRLLRSFKYFHYQFGPHHLYTENPGFTVKRVDFGIFEFNPTITAREGGAYVEMIARHSNIEVNELTQRYAKPNVPDNEILDMLVDDSCR